MHQNRKDFPTHLKQMRKKLNAGKVRTHQSGNSKGQVTLAHERKGKLRTIDFLVVNVLGDKPPLLSG